jgi:hypothetical protein
MMMKTTNYILTITSGIALAMGGLYACSNDGAEAGVTAAECVNNDLIAQCPPNTMASLNADSAAECSMTAGVSGDAVSVSASGESVCVGNGSCVILCELIVQCEFGVETVSIDEGVVCAAGAACGNDVCEGGENATDCPQDCAGVCVPSSARCTAGQLERCTLDGSAWEVSVVCEDGACCVEADGNASCVVQGDGEGGSSDEGEGGSAGDAEGGSSDEGGSAGEAEGGSADEGTDETTDEAADEADEGEGGSAGDTSEDMLTPPRERDDD